MARGDRDKHAKVLASAIRAREESVRAFSSSSRGERERWAVGSSLTNFGVNFDESELQSAAFDPPDVLFRDAAFELKEVYDKGRRRHGEFKASLKKAKLGRQGFHHGSNLRGGISALQEQL